MARGRGKNGGAVAEQASTSSGSGRGRGKATKAGEGGVNRTSKRSKINVSLDNVDSNCVELEAVSNNSMTASTVCSEATLGGPRDTSVSIHTAHSDTHSDEYVPIVPSLSTTILYSTLGHHQTRGVSESSSGSTVGTPAGSATPQSESADSSCDDSEQFSLASVLDKTRRVSSLSSTSSVVFNTSRDDDTNSPTDNAHSEQKYVGSVDLPSTQDIMVSEQSLNKKREAFIDESEVFKVDENVETNDMTDEVNRKDKPKVGKSKPKVASAIKEAMGKIFPTKQETSKKAKLIASLAIKEVFSPMKMNDTFDSSSSVLPTTQVQNNPVDKKINPIIAALEEGVNPFECLKRQDPTITCQTVPELDHGKEAPEIVSESVLPAIREIATSESVTSLDLATEVSPVKPKFKSWTDAIWGPPDLSPTKPVNSSNEEASLISKVDEENEGSVINESYESKVSQDQTDVAPDSMESEQHEIYKNPTTEPKVTCKLNSRAPRNASSKTSKKSRGQNSVSSNSTPSSGSPVSSTTPRSETPDMEAGRRENNKKSKSKSTSKKPSKPRRRIQCASDSEDSSVSTDSPLKPKTYTKSLDTAPSSPVEVPAKPTPKSTRIPKKKKEPETELKTEEIKSPVEELPLIPKGFHEQKKKLQDSEAKKKEIEAQELAEAENAELKKKEYELNEKERKKIELEDKKEVEMRLKSFKHLTENHYMCARKVNKQSKKMQCDCTLSKEEIREGEKGCGDDCLNRLLYIECGKVCQLEGNCSNKRFQTTENADIEVFKTDWKGFGIRARSFIPKDTFLMEYVGEVLDTKQFRKRAKQYARDDVQHFYFMALSKDFYVDATSKGNISRFINHSCDPNAETQKWTVNGELRVGFFTKRGVREGEELSFDYKYERYGNVAQKCYCGTSRCRGWLGGEPGSDSGIDEMDYWSSSEEEQEELSKETMAVAEQERKKKKKKRPAKKIKNFEVDEYEEEVERLSGTGVRNKLQTVQLCRLMVRANMLSTRLKLAELLLEADQPCLRLFLDYQGLRILSHWMFELEWANVEMELKLRIEAVLAILSIPHKTMLVDSKVLQTVKKWSTDSPGGSQPGSVEGDSQPQSRAATPYQSRASSPITVTGQAELETHTDVVDMEIDCEQSPSSEKQQEESPPGEDLFPPGEEPSSQVVPKTGEEIVEMPGCVDQGVGEVVRDCEAMVTSDQVFSVMKAQAGVAEDEQGSAEVESEKMVGDQVEPVPREQVPLTEEEERKRDEMGGEVTKVELSEEEKLVKDIQEKAKELLELWSILQEVFKIPKKERQAVRREHEREADRSYGGWGGETYTDSPESRLAMLQANAKLYASMQSNPGHGQQDRVQQHRGRGQGFSRGYQAPVLGYQENQGVMRGGYTGGRPGGAGPPARERRNLRLDDRTGRLSRSNLYRDDRRMLFQAKVEEEARQKVLRSAIAARHNQCCRLLGMDPVTTPMLNTYPEFYLSAGKWIPMPPPPLPIDPTWTTPMMAALPQEAFKPGDPPLTNPRSIYPPGICPERPLSPPPASEHPTESYDEVCAYYDRLFYRAPNSPAGILPSSNSPSPSPVPKKSRRSHSPSPFSKRLCAQISSNNSRPTSPALLSPSHPLNLDLSPDYRSPSPVHRSPLVSPTLPNSSSTRETNHTSRTAPTSVHFLSSTISTEELLPTRERTQLSPAFSTETPLSPSGHSDTQTVVHTQTHREADSAIIVKLPPKWKTARDSSGRVYYYHSVSRVTQWDPPSMEQEEEEWGCGEHSTTNHSMETADTDDEEDRSEEGEDTDTEDDSEEETEENAAENGGENKEEAEDGEIPDSDLSASEKRMLMRMRGRTKEERTNIRRLKKERDRERREHERMFNRERHTRHRRDGLVEEHLVPARISEKDKADLMTFKEMRERLLNKDKIREQQLKEEKEEDEKERREERARLEKIRKEERRAANLAKKESEFRHLSGEGDVAGVATPESSQVTPVKLTPQPSSSSDTPAPAHSTPVSSKKTTQAAADTSSDVEKKHKEKFVKEMSKTVVKILDPYRKKGVRGHIGNTDDFKHLAKKLTYNIMHKELKMCKSIEELKATEKVKKKASEYVSKYMKKYEREYKKSPDQDGI